ncbi:MAG: hypothetical protein ABSC64_02530 [Candidatus Korobacteraceae bacterium]|jgi:FtsP/CotA-like multicopper oxidase with cupredoxin domain
MQRAARLVLLSFVMTCTWAGTQANDIGHPFRLSVETNLHFHGLDVSPLKKGDNVFLHIAPGETFT